MTIVALKQYQHVRSRIYFAPVYLYCMKLSVARRFFAQIVQQDFENFSKINLFS